MARELWLSTIASAASGSTDEMLIPSNGAVLTIADMTSGNVNVQSYATGSWVTVETYTADTVINVGVSPGTLTRITWDTVVGTPTISLMYASDNGFAEAAGDIVTIEADIASINAILAATPRIVSQGTGLKTVSGTGAAIDMAPGLITIPGGLMSATGSVRITATWKFTGATAARTAIIKFGGTTYYSQAYASNILSATSLVTVHNKTTATQVGIGAGSASGLGGTTSTTVTSTVDTASAVAIQMTFTGNAADTASLEHWIVEYLP